MPFPDVVLSAPVSFQCVLLSSCISSDVPSVSYRFPFPVSAHDGIAALGKAHTLSAPSLSSLHRVALKSSNVGLVEHKLFQASEGGTASLHSCGLVVMSAVLASLSTLSFPLIPGLRGPGDCMAVCLSGQPDCLVGLVVKASA